MNRRLVDSISVTAAAVAIAVAAYSLISRRAFRPVHPNHYENKFKPVGFAAGNAELERLHDRFGEKYYSWHYEEWFIRDFFDDMRGGFFVDVGASHYSVSSNTFLLEADFEWSGIAIDAQERLRAGYNENRPRTKYFTYFVSDTSTGKTDLFVGNTFVASANKGFVREIALEITETIQVQDITLDALLDREGVKQIDFLSMDIELAEPAALRGFDIRRFAPKLVCIEDILKNDEFVEDYFEKHGYAKLKLWSRIDSVNAYYTPRELVEAKTPDLHD